VGEERKVDRIVNSFYLCTGFSRTVLERESLGVVRKEVEATRVMCKKEEKSK